MKKILLILMNTITSHFLQAQVNPTQWAHHYLSTLPDSLDYPLQNKRLDSAITILYPNDSSESGPRRIFDRYIEMSASRAPINGGGLHPSYIYNKVLQDAAKQLGACTGSYEGTWANIGPRNNPNLQRQGWISDIWVDPANNDIIIIGSELGGLFKTTDGGANWANISHNAMGIGCLGIRSFAVNPYNKDEIYFTTYNWGHQTNTWKYGMGVWHSIDGGANWAVVTGIPAGIVTSAPEFLEATEVEFLPYLIGSEAYVVMSIRNHVVGKKVNSVLWDDLTPSGLNPHSPSSPPLTSTVWPYYVELTNIYDFDFPHDDPTMKGIIIASSGGDDWNKTNASGVFKILIDPVTGVPGVASVIYDMSFNGVNFNIGSTTGPEFENPTNPAWDKMIGYTTEYVGNGNFYTMGYPIPSFVSGGGIANVHSIFKWHIGNPASITYIVYDIPTQFYTPQKKCAVAPPGQEPNIIYVGVVDAGNAGVVCYKSSSSAAWQFNILAPNDRLHADTRSIQLFSGTIDPLNPGKNDIVYYGTDGGLTKITNVNAPFPNSSTFDNLNGHGLFIADLWDVDHAEGKGIVAAGWHNGGHIFNRMNNTWINTFNGDGTNARIDRRFTTPTGFRLIYGGGLGFKSSELMNVTNTTSTFPPVTSISNPDLAYRWRYFPKQFVDDRMDFGNKKSYYSLPNAYGGPGGASWIDYFPTTSPIATGALQSHNCLSFQVAPSDPNVAYNLYHIDDENSPTPLTKKWCLARGTKSPPPLSIWGWQTITEPDVEFLGRRYYDILIDPKNADRIFTCYAGISWNNPGFDRVRVSTNGGVSFTDMSTGLTELPVNCLAYQNGSDDIIYAGTDAGVYYWDKPQGCWVKMGNVPAMVVKRIRINYSCGKLVVATYGRGIWEADLYKPAGSPSIPAVTDVINSNTTWSTNKFIDGSIRVRAGNTLTISNNSTVYMPKYGAIYVEANAKLIVSNGTITNDCATWYGIKADGNYSNQYIQPFTNLDPNHGIIQIGKGSIISNAEVAISNHSDGPNSQGGIIQCDEATFKNNWRSAEFSKFISSLPPPKDLSYFKGCTFEVDDQAPIGFGDQITMWGVNGIELSGNKFYNNGSLTEHHKSALFTIDASYKLNDWQLNGTPIPSIIKGFYYGARSDIYSLGSTGHPISISNTEFDKNEIALHLVNMKYPSIINNTFKIGAKQTPVPTTAYSYYSLGSKLEDVSNFTYCGNTHVKFYGPPVGPTCNFHYTAGTEIYNSGDIDQRVDKNSYSYLYVGNNGCMQCGTFPNGNHGLNYRCNSNVGNDGYDFFFQQKPIIRKIQDYGVGFTNYATGNTFSSTATVKHWVHDDYGNAPVSYYHTSAANQIPTLFTTGNLLPKLATQPANCSYACKSALVTNAYALTATNSELEATKNQYYTTKTNYEAYVDLYQQLIDGGNTEGTIDEIENANLTEAMILRNEMLATSPYLSQEVLRSLVMQNLLPNIYLLEIIVANPEASVSQEFLDFLQEEAPNPFPQYMINLIISSWSTGTLRSSLEHNMSINHQEMTQSKNDIITALRVMPDFYNEDSILHWMKEVPSLRNSYDIIEFLLNKRDYQASGAILTSLPYEYDFSELDQLEYDTYISLYNFKKDIIENEVEINQLDSPRIAQLKDIADITSDCFPRAMARSVLCFFYKICYPNADRHEIIPTQTRLRHSPLEMVEPKKEVTAYPNPANSYVAFYYNLSNGNEAKSLTVSDLMGKSVYQTAIKGSLGQHVWEIQKMNDGQYIYSVTTVSGEKFTGKITIKK